MGLGHEKRSELHKNSSVVISLVSGGCAGGLAKTFIAPLDRTKINFQINKHIKYSFRNALGFIRRTYRREGFFALYRGNSATLARILPYASCQFAAFEQFKKLLNVDSSKDPHFRRFLAGSLAGIVSSSVTYPLDLARARMAITDKCGYKNIWDVFMSIYTKENGMKSLFRGYLASVVGVVPYAGTSFFINETLKHKYCDLTGNEKKPNPFLLLIFGACAGLCGQTSSYPLDIVRRKMQTSGVINCEQYTTIRQTLRKVYIEEGIVGGFFKGVSMNWVKGPMATGISFASYDIIKNFLTNVHLPKSLS
ncbi:mitochondrial coenzyme A transporter SLC25A42 [Chironomus tepperi]|uniref:mitochondrial coenzyme A transporter SLC25A42 n=1 Tax=Chironomus tepperi TaxID=113505 RepID=UPI00391F33CD